MDGDPLHHMFRRDVEAMDWEHLWERQGTRAALAPLWWQLSGAQRGARVVELGSGPGYFALAYADHGADVLAVDLSADALAFLEARRAGRHVRTLVHDIEKGPLPEDGFDAIFLTNVLHHAERPVEMLSNLRHAGRLLVLAEFDPAGPGEVGPDIAHRLAPEEVARMLTATGWRPSAPLRGQPFEHYTIVAARGPPTH
jgi:SAM-dependent methyltransferase